MSRAVRVTVGADPGPRSGIWKVSSQGDDTYLLERSTSTEVKVSLHGSGRDDAHRVAAARPKPDVAGETFGAWPAPAPFEVGASVLYRVYVPTEELSVQRAEPRDKPKIELLDPAPAEHMKVLVIYQTRADVLLSPPSSMPTWTVATWSLRNGDQIWVIAHDAPVPDGLRTYIADAKAEKLREIDAGEHPVPPGHSYVRLIGFLPPDLQGVGNAFDAAPPGYH
jgi:hypothetical protein